MNIFHRLIILVLVVIVFHKTAFAQHEPLNIPNVRAVKINTGTDFSMDFYYEPDGKKINNSDVSSMARVFLAGLAFPNRQIWVNLSPYEQDRVMVPQLRQTELGAMLAQQDYILKKRAAELTRPDSPTGKEYWRRVNAAHEASQALNKVWIMPDHAQVDYDEAGASLEHIHLKVSVDQDIEAQKNHRFSTTVDRASMKAMKEVILPELAKEVNESPAFEPLRNLFRVLIMAHWFKEMHGGMIAPLDYIGALKVKGIDNSDPVIISNVYTDYQQTYKKGIYNFIKEEMTPEGLVPRKYFSGGVVFDPAMVTFVRFPSMRRTLAHVGVATVVFSALMATTGESQAAKAIRIDPQTRVALLQLGKGDVPSKVVVDVLRQQGQAKAGYKDFLKIAQQGGIQVLGPQQNLKNVYQLNQVIKEGDMLRFEYAPPSASGGLQGTATSSVGLTGDLKPLNNDASPPISAGAPPPDPPDPGEEKILAELSFEDTPPPTKVKIPPAKMSPFTLGMSGQTGYVTGGNSGFSGLADFQAGYGFNNFALFTGFGVTRPSSRSAETPGMMGNEATATSNPTGSDSKSDIYAGVHRTGRQWEQYLKISKPGTLQAGIEYRPTYDQGVSYDFGASAVRFPTSSGYRFGLMADGYVSFKLNRLFSIDIVNGNTYLSLTLKSVFSPGEGYGVGGKATLTYDHRWEFFAGLNPMSNLPLINDAFGHHEDMNRYRLGIAYRLSEARRFIAMWAQPVGHMNGGKPNMFFGFSWELGKKPFGHGDDARSVDFLRYPTNQDNAMSQVSRRRFLRGLAMAATSLASLPTRADVPSIDINAVYKIDPTGAGICGEPITILEIGAPLREAHMIYLSFMYWYLTAVKDISFEDESKDAFLKMSVWQWEDFLKERVVTKRHEDLARVVQKKILAQFASIKLNSFQPIKIDGKLFTKDFRQWLDKFIIKLERQGPLELNLEEGKIPQLESDKAKEIGKFLAGFVTPDDVKKLINAKAGSDREIMKQVDNWLVFSVSMNQWMIAAAQVKFKKNKVDVELSGTLGPKTLEAIRYEMEKSNKAMAVPINGGINFDGLDQSVAMNNMGNKPTTTSLSLSGKLVGMTFTVIKIQD